MLILRGNRSLICLGYCRRLYDGAVGKESEGTYGWQ
jgi:hypothetical protein